MPDADREFVHQLTEAQGSLLGYLASLLGNLHDARDVLQATNLALWEKRTEFITEAKFGPWARRFAYYEALALIRDRRRDKHVFDDDLVEQLARDSFDQGEEDERQLALRDCLTQLHEDQRKLIQQRYSDGGSIRQLMQSSGKKESAVKVRLMRIRHALLLCIEAKMEAGNA
ncbi:RNA polymerase sigma-70 factor, ECF subfamily [Neorhodopirellula lusitana]|uniref:RNA polymerase sigma-70 factor, ECF subfamily n=1 Tax=Neorhodopirellula lusitana TaxID=445327 RepID=A0ABY1PTA4_9BACT|nr:sigma-70 family RNA polymerase sigma factor [Neorhodopirellula lusitana]SMP46689.1 RNA polymerase sigma-70 factor, ECF subfamily [Neorhodopirellula lusitana]